MGGSLGKSESSNTSVTNPSTVWGGQSPYLQGLYQQGANMQRSNPYAQQIQNQTSDPMQQMLSGGYSPGGMQGYTNDPRLNNLTGLASGQAQNQALGGAIQAGLGDISRNFREGILPGINAGAALSNTSGGSRQGVAQGLAAGKANQQASDFVNRMRSQNYATGLNTQMGALGQIGDLQGTQNQFAMGMNQMQPGIAQNQNMATLSALQQSPQLANMGWANQWNPLMNYAQLLGSPTVLGGGGASSGGSQGWNMAGGIGTTG